MSIRIVRFLNSIKDIEDPYKQIELIEEEKEMLENELRDQMNIIECGYMTAIQKAALNFKRAWEIYKVHLKQELPKLISKILWISLNISWIIFVIEMWCL